MLRGLPEKREWQISTDFHHYTRDEFLGEFYPDPADQAAITAGIEQLHAEQRACRLAEMRQRLGVTQSDIADFGDQRLAFAEPGYEAA